VLASSGVKPIGGLATGVVILLLGATAASAALAVAAFYRARLADRLLDGGLVTFDDLNRADSLVQGTSILYLLALITAGIVWIVWQHRYASNAQRLGGKLGLGPGWAIGGWFIPLAAPVLAAVQLSQAVRETDDRRAAGWLIPAWVVAWFVGGVIAAVGATMRPDSEDPGDLRDFARADCVAGVGAALITAAGVLAVLMIRNLSSRQTRAAERRAVAIAR